VARDKSRQAKQVRFIGAFRGTSEYRLKKGRPGHLLREGVSRQSRKRIVYLSWAAVKMKNLDEKLASS
jgi:hypothetical protein